MKLLAKDLDSENNSKILKGKPDLQTSQNSHGTRQFLRNLQKEPDPLRRKLLLIGYVFDALAKQEVVTYLVGGEAVEVYTAGQFETGDIDITASNRTAAEGVFRRLGFKKEGMIWINENLGIAFQIVADYPTRTEKIRTIQASDFTIKVVGVEDLIIDRLIASKYWRSNPKMDLEQATVLIRNFKGSIDLEYLKRRAREERVEDTLRNISKMQ